MKHANLERNWAQYVDTVMNPTPKGGGLSEPGS